MEPARAVGLAAILLTVAVAGCFGGDEVAPVKTISASGGMASDGYAYDGQGLEQANAELSGWVDDPQDTGSLNVSFEFAGSTWEVSYGSFSGQEDFKDGGVEFGLVEHGDSGVSTPIIPTIDGEVVTYGTATVLRDGQPAIDPQGDTGPWAAHLMLSRDTIRSPDGLITKADGSTPYDPNTPADAQIIDDDPQGFLQLTAPSGPDSARDTLRVQENLSLSGADQTQSVTVDAGPGGDAVVNVTASGGDNPVAAGTVRIWLTSEDGTQLATDNGQVTPNQDYSTSLSVEDLNGTFDVNARGNGSFTVTIDARVTYDDHPFIIITWDDYTTEARDDAPTAS